MLRHLAVLLAAVAFATAAGAQDGGRYALIIGNSDYQTPGWELANPASDARLIAGVLEELDFTVELLIDASLEGMEEAFAEHADRLSRAGPDAIGLLYYAGHAVQSDGRNYLMPVDQEIRTEQDVWRKAAQLSLAMEYLRSAGNRINMIILDACRNNPLPSTARDASGAGLASQARQGGLLIAYATAPGQTAADGTSENSPFTRALASLLPTPGLPAELLFKRVTDRVLFVTGGAQQPWYESGLSGEDFCFASCDLSAVESSVEVDAQTEDADDFYWEIVQLVGSKPGLDGYLQRFPNGKHADSAREQIAALDELTMADVAANPRSDRRIETAYSQEARVREAQVLLAAMGYAPGPTDGELGISTAVALDTFRRAYNLPAGDDVDTQMLETLRLALGEGHRAVSEGTQLASLDGQDVGAGAQRIVAPEPAASPIPVDTAIARPTSETVIGRWCADVADAGDGRSSLPSQVTLNRSEMSYSWPNGDRQRYQVASITPNGGSVEVEWLLGSDRMATAYGDFTATRMTQIGVRRQGDTWNENRRSFHRCD